MTIYFDVLQIEFRGQIKVVASADDNIFQGVPESKKVISNYVKGQIKKECLVRKNQS
jgi:hypothetical protein